MTLQTILKSGATLVLLALLMPASAGQTRDPATYFFHDSFNDLREEGEIARLESKVGVLVMVEPAAIVAPAPTSRGATSITPDPTKTLSPISVRCFAAPS